MKIVIDTNILFSSLLSKDNVFINFIFSKQYKKYTCNYLFIEIFKHKEKFLKLSKLDEDKLLIQLKNIVSQINFISEEIIPTEIFNAAYKLCNDIDEKDTPFVALTIFLDAVLLTGDKKLTNNLRKKGFTSIESIKHVYSRQKFVTGNP
jgi:putative PIN family toxin of toxin-antitoxin system